MLSVEELSNPRVASNTRIQDIFLVNLAFKQVHIPLTVLLPCRVFRKKKKLHHAQVTQREYDE